MIGTPIVCKAIDQCHTAGVCNSATGFCSNPVKPDGAACDDDNLCTLQDTCNSGICSHNTTVTCTALDDCHDSGVCNPATGVCSNPNSLDGKSCNDGNLCSAVKLASEKRWNNILLRWTLVFKECAWEVHF